MPQIPADWHWHSQAQYWVARKTHGRWQSPHRKSGKQRHLERLRMLRSNTCWNCKVFLLHMKESCWISHGLCFFPPNVPRLNWQSHTTDTHPLLCTQGCRAQAALCWVLALPLAIGKGLFLHSCGRTVTPQSTKCLWRELSSASTCPDFIFCPYLENISRVTFSALLVTRIKISTVLFNYMEISPTQEPQSAVLDTTASKYTKKI